MLFAAAALGSLVLHEAAHGSLVEAVRREQGGDAGGLRGEKLRVSLTQPSHRCCLRCLTLVDTAISPASSTAVAVAPRCLPTAPSCCFFAFLIPGIATVLVGGR